jgi:CRISPR-associated protein Cas2
MYVLLVYDIREKRVGKMLRLCRRYLNWIQNSVFEGEITEVKLDTDEDSVLIFKSRSQQWLEKQVVGQERNRLDTFL